jgi:hypothetical protein
MALIDISNQYRYSGRGPFDAKSLVKTYADLLDTETWTTVSASGASVVSAYNGLITAVWLNKDDISKNGIYFLYDPEVTSPLKTPNVTLASNWHKLCNLSDIQELSTQIEIVKSELNELGERVTALEEDSDVITYGYRSGFPTEGEANKMYVAADEGKTYIWFNNEYLPVGGSGEAVSYTQIHGGNAKD